ncbi:MAG: hypothetical protein FJX53_07000 [Alphaproteobacteria bacterium]|nr:hypothetical protein [Alphaproteobacteria bacterium]
MRAVLSALSGALLMLLAAAPLPAAAQDLNIAAFHGRFQGSGVSENADSLYFGVTVRDFDVTLGPDGAGFFVEWTTVIHSGDNSTRPEVRRRTDRMVFAPAGPARVWRATPPGNPWGDGIAWAKLKKQTLTVPVMRVTEDGGWIVQSYARTLTGTGMELDFVVVRDGEAQRHVKGRLVKVAG